ncbi:MAG: hypothetical protein AB7K24_31785, partial [Gemmataceae bacterium]
VWNWLPKSTRRSPQLSRGSQFQSPRNDAGAKFREYALQIMALHQHDAISSSLKEENFSTFSALGCAG